MMPNRSTMAQTSKSAVVISPANKKENNGRTPPTSKVQGIRPVLATQKRRGKLQQQETAPPTAVKRPAAPPRRRLQRTTLFPNHRQSVRDDGAGAETQNEDKSLSRPNPPNEPLTVDDCLTLLQLRRPLEPNTEHGLAAGIGTHLTENIKLSGLRKARETALLDMVKTLTRHLENREETIVTWVAFADKVRAFIFIQALPILARRRFTILSFNHQRYILHTRLLYFLRDRFTKHNKRRMILQRPQEGLTVQSLPCKHRSSRRIVKPKTPFARSRASCQDSRMR